MSLRLEIVTKIRTSKFSRDAFIMFILNLIMKILGFFGTAYSLRCLGPINVGVSATIQAYAQQATLLFNGGFDIVAVRKIAHSPEDCNQITKSIIGFRIILSIMIVFAWIMICAVLFQGRVLMTWSLGGFIILFSAMGLTFAFQGMEKLPVTVMISAIAVIFSTTSFFVFFRPDMPLGSDLIVIVGALIVSNALSIVAYSYHFKSSPFGKIDLHLVRSLFKDSWYYWALALVTFSYTTFQIPLINYFLGSENAGIYRSSFALAYGVEMIFNSINSLLLPRLVSWKKQSIAMLWNKQKQLFKIFVLIAAFVCFGFAFSASTLYYLFLGKNFIGGDRIFQILVFGRGIVFVGQIYAWGLVALELDRIFLLISTVGALASITLNIFLVPIYGLAAAAFISLAVELFIHFAFFLSCWLHITMKNNE